MERLNPFLLAIFEKYLIVKVLLKEVELCKLSIYLKPIEQFRQLV